MFCSGFLAVSCPLSDAVVVFVADISAAVEQVLVGILAYIFLSTSEEVLVHQTDMTVWLAD